jgi:hypothetical protein
LSNEAQKVVKASEILTAIVAIYGAVLSTVVAARQILGERVRVKVAVRRNMQMVGDPRYQGMTLTILTVTNIGRRPVTITTFGTTGLYPNPSFVAVDTQPPLPCQITEGGYITSIWPQADLDFSTIDYWAAWDSHGRMYRLQEASRLTHWKSVLQLKRSFRKRTT